MRGAKGWGPGHLYNIYGGALPLGWSNPRYPAVVFAHPTFRTHKHPHTPKGPSTNIMRTLDSE